ncbi:MAG TPA: response regulator transcription factor [Candidatus Limnocylindrales bacterium]|nr:response regulator transcription factor [Candidatus Limnocylindrales bacterium]
MTDPSSAQAPLRVLLVDPDDCVRESLAGLLGIGQRCFVVGTAGTAEAAIRLAAELDPEVVVVDPRVPGDGATALIAQVRQAAPRARVLVLNWSDTADLSSGADAYTRKTFRPQELIDAVVATKLRH